MSGELLEQSDRTGTSITVAVPADGQLVATHFAKALTFVLALVGPGRVDSVRIIGSPRRSGGGYAETLSQQGVVLVIAGGIGEQATAKMQSAGIEVQSGHTGCISDILKRLAASMQSTTT